ncbi:MAG: hypothetical protein U9O96_00255 [Candidatus Thermoplasmatota archaeon]|nr:hypothetical protein [Candidatus Thermoplasmatota archaeon]
MKRRKESFVLKSRLRFICLSNIPSTSSCGVKIRNKKRKGRRKENAYTKR